MAFALMQLIDIKRDKMNRANLAATQSVAGLEPWRRKAPPHKSE
jgi:hypothetical protein